jgi:integrase
LKGQTLAVRTLATFCIFYECSFPNVSTATLLSFTEFLADNHLAPSTITNYISSIKAVFRRLAINVSQFDSNLLKLSLKSLERNAPVRYKPKPILSIEQINVLLNNAKQQSFYVFFKLSVLLAFLAMLRISNIACVSLESFDILRNITRGDIVKTNDGLSITIKWSKTLQSYRQSAIVNVPQIPGSELCPVAAFDELNKKYPVNENMPLMAYQVSNKTFIVKRNVLQSMLKQAATKSNILHNITYHIFRRSAASIAFAAGVPFQQIQAHGTWASESIWSYIHHTAKASLLPKFFRDTILTTPTFPSGFGS